MNDIEYAINLRIHILNTLYNEFIQRIIERATDTLSPSIKWKYSSFKEPLQSFLVNVCANIPNSNNAAEKINYLINKLKIAFQSGSLFTGNINYELTHGIHSLIGEFEYVGIIADVNKFVSRDLSDLSNGYKQFKILITQPSFSQFSPSGNDKDVEHKKQVYRNESSEYNREKNSCAPM